MCGFAGYVSSSNSASMDVARAMSDKLQHRGPDASGIWINTEKSIALGHRRLSIIDLTDAGAQPMKSRCGRYVLTFNGEIYNHVSLRLALEADVGPINWRGQSDTETLLQCLTYWTLKKCLNSLNGMFAFALWDQLEEILILARDKFGEKPLYYGWQGLRNERCFLFGSELKALKANPVFSSEINRNSLCLYLRHGYIPAPHSIYEDIKKLQPGEVLTLAYKDLELRLNKYWSFGSAVQSSRAKQYSGSYDDAVADLDVLLTSSVREKLISDVEVGAFLSGGIDSSAVASLMQENSVNAVKTYSIGFDEQDYNEANYATSVAKYLGTDHCELYVSPKDCLEVLPQMPSVYCEPFADVSQIPTFIVAKLASQNLSVVLSGDGGDELFAGYNRHIFMKKYWRYLKIIPKSMKPKASLVSSVVSLLHNSTEFFSERQSGNAVWSKLHKVANIIAANSVDELYLQLKTTWNSNQVVLNSQEPKIYIDEELEKLDELDDFHQMLAFDTLNYLPDDILVKLDRATMAVSLEARAPFLDINLMHFAWSLPINFKVKGNTGKRILRDVLYRHVPRNLVERPKKGFSVPIESWLRGELRDWAEYHLAEDKLKKEGFFNVSIIRQKWLEHLSEKKNWAQELWYILMFQAWLEEQSL